MKGITVSDGGLLKEALAKERRRLKNLAVNFVRLRSLTTTLKSCAT